MKFKKMNTLLVFSIFLMCESISYAFTTVPVNSFDSWYEVEQSQQFQSTSNTVTMTTSSEGNLWHEYPNAVGITGKINCMNINGTASAGFGMHVGTIDSYRVHVNITVQASGNDYYIYYRIRLRDDNNNFVRDLGYGLFGGSDEPVVGNDITIGFARSSNEIWFYVDGYARIKWDALSQMGSGEDGVWLFGWAESGSSSSITALFSDIGIIYSYGENEIFEHQTVSNSNSLPALISNTSLGTPQESRFMTPDGETILSNSANIYGSSGDERVALGDSVCGVSLDQNIERVDLTGVLTDYLFQQSGNRLQIYDGNTLLVTMPVQPGGSQVVFDDGMAEVKLNGIDMSLGGVILGTTPSSASGAVLTSVP